MRRRLRPVRQPGVDALTAIAEISSPLSAVLRVIAAAAAAGGKGRDAGGDPTELRHVLGLGDGESIYMTGVEDVIDCGSQCDKVDRGFP